MPKSKPSRARYSDPIANYLAARSFWVPSSATLRHAVSKMGAHGIRHLPVLEGQRVAGLVRESDLHTLERFAEAAFETMTVAEVMCFDVHFVHPFDTLGAVVEDMQRCRFDHAVVIDRTSLVGIFTTTDALLLLGAELGANLEIAARVG